MTAKPYLRFYPVDWRGDAKLKGCSLAARGLWIELIALMHEGTPYGHLVIGTKAPTPVELARLIGVSASMVTKALAELEAHGVAHRTEAGVVFSKRMVRDDERAFIDRENGRLGGNPQVKGGVNPPVKATRGHAHAHAGNGSGSSSGVDGVSGGEPERGPALVVAHHGQYDLSPGQLQAAAPGLIGAWNAIAASAPPFVAVEGVRSNPKLTYALRAHPSIDWWGDLFQRVVRSDFLRCDAKMAPVDLWWVLDHYEEIAAGRYDNRDARGLRDPNEDAVAQAKAMLR